MTTSIMKNKSLKKLSLYMLSIFFWILIWKIVSHCINREAYLPSPFQTYKALKDLLFESSFYISVFSTIIRVFIGFFLSCVLGIILGFLCYFFKFIHILFLPLISAIRSTPVISIIIIALVWYTSNNVPIFISFLMCFPIIWGNMLEGLNNVDYKLIEMTKVYNIKPYRVITKVYLPALLPYLIAGMSTALGIAWKVTVAAEVLSLPKFAIGTHLYDSKVYVETSYLFAWTIVVVLLSFIFENLFRRIIKRFITWR